MADASINHIQLRWIASEVNPAYRWVKIMIDERNLVDLVTEWESRIKLSVKSRNEYKGVPEYLFAQHEYYADAWFGFRPVASVDDHYGSGIYGDKVSLLECGNRRCGVVDCWPFTCEISVTDDLVIWHSFENPVRTELALEFDDHDVKGIDDPYAGFGPFTFLKSEYVVELNALLKDTEYGRPVSSST
ncbi:hypothetical protein HNQ07_001337 [Deinococcus metalli]|uniref:Uncharacterized protein n=1 Tax=Deinococcus metalli TaxID=1141878 RepID=A0A7W8KCW0_9DEIO|nr:hypothetical protein [Deinococcus metalli]MBB5375880.1 hypothetical protein [Deinococcus metalli]GHF36346.1 hypothetical protein GCM10017781_11230 [Deinococcus metalli]